MRHRTKIPPASPSAEDLNVIIECAAGGERVKYEEFDNGKARKLFVDRRS